MLSVRLTSLLNGAGKQEEKLDQENENETAWVIELGFYPGVLLGFRSYIEEDISIHVLYLPFLDIALKIFK